MKKILYSRKNFWGKNALQKNWKKFCTAEKISETKMGYEKIGKNFVLQKKFLKWKCALRNLEEIPNLGKNFLDENEI